MDNYAKILFIDDVLDLQNKEGSGDFFVKAYPGRTKESLDESDAEFIEARESFYIASISSTGWPYVQHRGGPKGFLKVIGDNLLGYADYCGNRQFITMGHVAKNDKIALFLMDYENQARLKILGRIKIQAAEEADPSLYEKLATKGEGKVERIATIKVTAMDWNCPKYIPQLINIEKVKAFTRHEFKTLQEENDALKKELKRLKSDADI